MMWWRGRMIGVDFETTGPLPEEARIVTAAVVAVGGGLDPSTQAWLADPGVPIPEGATEVHGISTAQAQADGRPAPDVLAELLECLRGFVRMGLPLVIYNARYDLTVLDREARRYGLEPLNPTHLLVVDPFVVDKFLDRFRRGSRKLETTAQAYDAVLDGAHDAGYDALAACRIAYRIGQRGEVKRRVRNRQEGWELKQLKAEWEDVRHDVGKLHRAQVGWALEERARFAEYKDSIGEHDEALRIRSEVGWPVLEPMPHETLEPEPLS